jgi:hypothetical protein
MRTLSPEVVTFTPPRGEESVPLEGQVLRRALPSIEFDVLTPAPGELEDSVVFVGVGTPSEPYEVSSSDLVEVLDPGPSMVPRHSLWNITAPNEEEEELSVSRPILLTPEAEMRERSTRAARISWGMLAVAILFGLVALQLETPPEGAGGRSGRHLQRALRTEAPRPVRVLIGSEPQPPPVFTVAHWTTPPGGASGAEPARPKPAAAVVAPHLHHAPAPSAAPPRKIPTK